MRTIIAIIAAAATTLGVAAPAAAKVMPPPAMPALATDDPGDLDDLDDPGDAIAIDPAGVAPYGHQPERVRLVERITPPPPRRERRVPRESFVLAGTALTARMPEGAGRLGDLGRGAALNLSWLPRRCGCPVGASGRAMFLGGEDSRVYSLDIQMVATPKLGRRLAVPFVSVGLGFGTVRFVAGKQTSSGLALGPVGSLGLHGFLSDAVYWRAELGAMGAGGAVVIAGASLGWVLGR